MNINRWLTLLTLAGLAGLVLFNASAATSVIDSLSQASNSYVTTVQGRGKVTPG